MANWKSPEEAEAWWSELQELKGKVNKLEERLVGVARGTIISFPAMLQGLAPAAKRKYLDERGAHYIRLIGKSKDEAEMFSHLKQYLKEFQTYLKSG